MDQTQTKTCFASFGDMCSCPSTNIFCDEHGKATISLDEQNKYNCNPSSFRNPPQPYTAPANTCGWGSLQYNPMARCMAQPSAGCGNLCKVHYDMFQKDSSCAPEGTQIIHPQAVVPKGTVSINLPESVLKYLKKSGKTVDEFLNENK